MYVEKESVVKKPTQNGALVKQTLQVHSRARMHSYWFGESVLAT